MSPGLFDVVEPSAPSAAGSKAACGGKRFVGVPGRDQMSFEVRRIDDFVPRAALRDRSDAWWLNTKASDEFLDRLFVAFFKTLGLPNLLQKTDYHVLARYVPRDQIDPEVAQVLDAIVDVASRAQPAAPA
jgi:hypothetical protein